MKNSSLISGGAFHFGINGLLLVRFVIIKKGEIVSPRLFYKQSIFDFDDNKLFQLV
jgi:hypothetical protein